MPAYINEHRQYGAASNDWAHLRNTMDMVPLGVPGNTPYRVRDAASRERSITVARTLENAQTSLGPDRGHTAVVRDLGTGFGYLDLARATVADVTRALQESSATRALIIDARGTLEANPDGNLPAPLQLTLRRTSRLHNPTIGKHTLRLASEPCFPDQSQLPHTACVVERRQSDDLLASDTATRYRGRVVVLIDERTEGPMEQFAMAMETVANATLIGSATAGAVGRTSAIRVPGLLTLTFSNTELRRPDGGQLQRVGLSPQVDARPTVKGIRAGSDEVLDRAQAWLKEQLDPPVRRRR